MSPPRLAWLVVLCLLGISFVWADYAWGHRRTHESWWQDHGQEVGTQAFRDYRELWSERLAPHRWDW